MKVLDLPWEEMEEIEDEFFYVEVRGETDEEFLGRLDDYVAPLGLEVETWDHGNSCSGFRFVKREK